jgi:CBS domain-containing protein
LRIPPDLTLQDAVDDYFMRYDHGAFPVEERGRTIGLLTMRGVRRVPRQQWPTRRVRDLMVPLGDQVAVPPHARMDQVMGKLEDSDANRVLVVADGEMVGIITPSDLTRWLRRWRGGRGQSALNRQPSSWSPGHARCWDEGVESIVRS